MEILLGISKNFRNVSVDFLCNYKKDLFSGHFVYKLENEEVNTIGKTFKRCKSAGYKKTHHRVGDGYAGSSKRQVLKRVTRNERLRNFNVRFTNKAKPRLVSVKRIQEQHQIDLVDMKSMKVEYKEKCY